MSAWIDASPRTALAAFLALHLVAWTALPSALYPNLPLDLIEALTYGREWQLGYDKLPPLPWWLVEITYRLIGRDFGYYALAQVSVVAAFAVLWRMGCALAGPARALAALLIVDGLHYFNYTAAKFNHDVIQLPLWALAGYAYWRALKAGRLVHWLLLGVALGLALWAKYFVVILAIPLAAFLLLDREARSRLATPGPWLAAAAALVVAAPHLYWLVANDFLPFGYASARAAPSRGIIDHLLHPLSFAAGQAGFLLPAALIAAPLVWPRAEPQQPTAGRFDRRIVALLAFGPVATLLVLSLLTGRGLIAMWGYPLWLFLGLWLVLRREAALDPVRLGRAAGLWALVFAGYALAFVVNYSVLPRYDHRYRAVFFPGERLAAELAARFRQATGQPLAYVIADMWTGGNVGHYARERPRVLIDGRPARAPWIDLADLRRRGAVVVWTSGDLNTMPANLREIGGGAELQVPLTLPYHVTGEGARIGWAILRPQP